MRSPEYRVTYICLVLIVYQDKNCWSIRNCCQYSTFQAQDIMILYVCTTSDTRVYAECWFDVFFHGTFHLLPPMEASAVFRSMQRLTPTVPGSVR